MAVNMAAIQEIVGLLDRIIGAQATAAQQQRLEALFETLINQGNSILDREQRAIELLSQILARVSANQTQTAANAITLAQTYRAVQAVPAASADSVWGATNPFVQQTYQDAMGVVMYRALLEFFAQQPVSYPIATHFVAYPFAPSGQDYTGPARSPAWDDTQILPTDTLKSFLDRTAGVGTWEYPIFQPHDGYLFNFGTSSDPFNWVCIHTDVDFAEYKQYLFNPGGSAAANVPPVWPGLSKVTLGSTVPIAPPTQTVTGPLDGVLVQITAVPTPVGYYQFGPDRSYVKIGGVAFKTDDGYDEEAQPVSFQQHIITPRRQVRAQSALFRWVTGVEGTITPWTIT